MSPREDDTCEHGNEGFCMLCCRAGENKPAPKEEPRTDGPRWAGDYDEPSAP